MENLLRSRRFWLVLIPLLCMLVFLIRITGPTDLEGYAQHRNVGYVMDMMWQGNWIVQHDIQGRILSKPPLHTWLSAPFAAALGVDRVALALPSFLSVLALAMLVFEVGRRRFGILAGGFAAMAVVLAPMMSKHIALVRSDAFFAFAVAVAAFAAYRAWERGAGWTLFWFAAGIATMAKGPLGPVLAAAGLLSYFWEKRSDPAIAPPRGAHLPGIALFLLMTVGWFMLAFFQHGYALIDKMIFDELLGQATGARKDSFPGENLPKPILHLFARFLPFSLFLFYALWRGFRQPSSEAGERRFERFLICWILSGLLIFSLAAHHRPDLLLPLWPACALLAGRELARIATRMGTLRFVRVAAPICALLLVSVFLTYHSVWGKRAERSEVAEAVRDAASALALSGISPERLAHFGTPVTLQMYLGTFRPWLALPELQMLVIRAEEPVYIASDRSLEAIGLDTGRREVELAFRWPEDQTERALLKVFRVAP